MIWYLRHQLGNGEWEYTTANCVKAVASLCQGQKGWEVCTEEDYNAFIAEAAA